MLCSMENQNCYKILALDSGSAARVLLYGPIGGGDPFSPQGGVIARQFVEELAEIKAKSISVHINSPGGNLVDGIAIYNALVSHPAVVSIFVDGQAASAASLVAMAADVVMMSPTSSMMIHGPHVGTSGNARDLEKTAAMLRKHTEFMVPAYSKRLGRKRAEAMLSDGEDHYFTADECLKLGLCDDITGPDDSFETFASDMAQVACTAGVKKETIMTLHAPSVQAIEAPEHAPTPTPTPAPAQETVSGNLARLITLDARRRELAGLLGSVNDLTAPPPAAYKAIAAAMADEGIALEETRNSVLTAFADAEANIMSHIPSHSVTATASYGGHGSDHFVRAATDALLMKAGQRVENPAPGAADLRHLRLSDIAKASLGSHSRLRDGAAPYEAVRAAMNTVDFPLILENIASNSLMTAYESEPASHRRWVRPSSVEDFKEVARVAISTAPNLLAVPEGASYTSGSLTERGEKFQILTYGRILQWTRQAMVNDDVGGFARAINAFGRAAARLESDLVYGVLADNPVMSDTKTLFHADHGNLMPAGGLDVASLAAARTAMRIQKDISGTGFLNLIPRFLIVGAGDELTAEQLLNSVYQPDVPANATPAWVRGLELVVEPRVASGFYLVADYNQAESIELATLDGQGVHVEDETSFDNDAYSVKARLDVGVAAIDWVGISHTPAVV
jgi:ATP-dependent Clp endopeptidase proteolytic subunit ClpP